MVVVVLMLAGAVVVVYQVEQLTNTWDWQDFFAPLELNISGLAIQEHDQEVNHAIRFIRREDLKNYMVEGKPFSWPSQDEHWGDYEQSPLDCVVLIKQFLHSTHLSQPPILSLPHAQLKKMKDPLPIKYVPRNLFSKRMFDEYRKTADVCGMFP